MGFTILRVYIYQSISKYHLILDRNAGGHDDTADDDDNNKTIQTTVLLSLTRIL